MSKKLKALIFLMFADAVFISCNLFNQCGPFPMQRADIQSWKIVTISDTRESISGLVSRPYDKIFKGMLIDKRVLVKVEEVSDGLQYKTLMACTPPEIAAIQKINSMRIIAANEVAYLHDKDLIISGDDITERFVMARLFESNFQSVESFIQSRTVYLDDYYTIRLKDNPYQETSLVFKIVIAMSDGKIYEFENERITVH